MALDLNALRKLGFSKKQSLQLAAQFASSGGSAVPAGQTTVDEFEDGVLDPVWTRVDPAGAGIAGSIGWSETPGELICTQLAGANIAPANAIHGLMRPLSGAGGALGVGDGFIIGVTHFGPIANFLMSGIVLSDGVAAGAGAQVAGLCYGVGASPALTTNAWSGTGWALSGSTADVVHRSPGRTLVRLAQVAANTWRADASLNGINWLLGANLSRVLTPTHVGLVGSQWGTFTKGVISYDFLRRVSGVS
jgi:hypothetical protein